MRMLSCGLNVIAKIKYKTTRLYQTNNQSKVSTAKVNTDKN